MSIDGVLNHQIRQERPANEKAPAKQPDAVTRGGVPEGDIIDIKAMKAILYLGLRGDVYLPVDEGHAVDTHA